MSRAFGMRLVIKSILWQCAALITLLIPAVANAGPQRLRLAYFASSNDIGWEKVLKPFIDAVNRDGRGIIEIQGYPNGALGKSISQQTQVIMDGVADISVVVPGLTPGRFPDNSVLNLPLAFHGIREATLVDTAMIASGKLRGYDNYHLIGVFATPPLSLHTRTPVRTLDDLKGMRIRTTGQLTAKMMRALGAAPVMIGPAEVGEALARGTVDGTVTQFSALVDFGLARVVSNHYLSSLESAELLVLMNRKKFDALPKPAQDIIRKYSGKWISDLWIRANSEKTDQIVKEFSADPSKRLVYPKETDNLKLSAAAQIIRNQWMAKDPRNPALLTLLTSEIEKVRADGK